MSVTGITPQVNPMQNQWVEEAQESPAVKRAEELKGEKVTKPVETQTTQAPQSTWESSADKSAEKPKAENPRYGGLDVYA